MSKPVTFVAEIGMNYEGNFDLAYELIRKAKWAGADIAKFQFGWRDKPGEINCIDIEKAQKLKDWCRYLDIELMVSVITEQGFELARQLDLPRYKIASRTVIDKPELVQKVLAEGKQTIVSLGMWNDEAWPFGPADGNRLRYLFCRSAYPTYPKDIVSMPERFEPTGYFGYSDHCHGIAACLLAISRGARLIEKHFTLNKSSQVIRDHTLSATPEEFKQLVELGDELGRLTEAVRLTAPLELQHK